MNGYNVQKLPNLRWGAPVENTTDKERHGTLLKGPRHPVAKLSEEEVLATRRRYHHTKKDTLKSLADEYGVSFQLISEIVRRRVWKHI